MEKDIGAVSEQVREASAFVYRLREEIGKGIDDADSGRFSKRTVDDILHDVLAKNRK